MDSVQIGNFEISPKSKPFIIAEAGINHNGELEKALKMIKIAKTCGAQAVKFQTFKSEEFVSDPNQVYTYTSQGKKITESMLEMFKRYEFSKDDWIKIKQKCDAENIMFLSTPLNKSDLDFLIELGVPAIKLGSGDLTNLPFLKHCSATKLPIIFSCGMATLAEILEALKVLQVMEKYPLILLLTTSEYPTSPENVNLLKLRTLSEKFPDILLGFSDHTQCSLASSLAIALGACVFEKHFTLDHDLPGPDHWFSADPEELTDWITSIKISHKLLGDPLLNPTKEELEMRKLARKSIVTLQDIKKGEEFSENNLGIKRPGTGLEPVLFTEVIGKKALRPLKKGCLLSRSDYE